MKTLFPLLSLALFSLAACDDGEGTATDDPIGAIVALGGDAANGETLYGANCSGCHATDGSGGVGPSLIDSAPSLSDEDVVDVMYYGEGSMPAYSDTLSDQDIADLLAYLRATFG